MKCWLEKGKKGFLVYMCLLRTNKTARTNTVSLRYTTFVICCDR